MKNCENCKVWEILKHLQPDYKIEGKPMKRICVEYRKGIPEEILANKVECPEKVDKALFKK